MEPWGEGKGFLSDIVKFKIVYDKVIPGLPITMIVKMPLYRIISDSATQNYYEREIRYYTEIAPISPIRVPKLIYSSIDSEAKRYILILEDCSQYKMIDQIEGLDYKQTTQVITSIADFHARWWDAPDLFSFDWMPKPKEGFIMDFIDIFRVSWDFSIRSKNFDIIFPEGSRKIGDKMYKHYPWLINSIPEQKLTISHFDLRAENIFFDSKDDKNPVIILDWGTAVISVGILDIAYLLAGSLKIDLRRKIEKEMIKLYLKRLEENGIVGLDFDFIWEYYLRSLLCYIYLPTLTFTLLNKSVQRTFEMQTITIKRFFTAMIDNDAIDVCPS
ncbi:MAG: phosphotransferase [Candidatus Thorarchaeota archaeon]